MSDKILSLRFLIIDDMRVMRKIYRKSLSVMGVDAENIQEAEDGLPAWEILEKSEGTAPIQFIISDWNMPGMTGLDLLKKIRTDARFKDLPFVMVTAENSPEQIKEALAAGVDNFVSKPFTPDDLISRVRSTYNKKLQA